MVGKDRGVVVTGKVKSVRELGIARSRITMSAFPRELLTISETQRIEPKNKQMITGVLQINVQRSALAMLKGC